MNLASSSVQCFPLQAMFEAFPNIFQDFSDLMFESTSVSTVLFTDLSLKKECGSGDRTSIANLDAGLTVDFAVGNACYLFYQ